MAKYRITYEEFCTYDVEVEAEIQKDETQEEFEQRLMVLALKEEVTEPVTSCVGDYEIEEI